MARTEFGRLSDAELALLLASPAGQWAYYEVVRDKWRTATEPPKPESAASLPEFSEPDATEHPWGPDRNVRAELIRWLCVSKTANALVDPLGMQLQGARVVGSLNLREIRCPFQLDLRFCRLVEPAHFDGCFISNLSLTGCWTNSIAAEGLVATGSVNMNRGFHCDGEIDLVGAKIDGNLDFSDATIISKTAYSIVADNIKATNIFLGADWRPHSKGFKAVGTVWLPGAIISGDFGGNGAEFIRSRERAEALSLERATVGGAITLGDDSNTFLDKEGHEQPTAPAFSVDGVVDLRGVRCERFRDSNWKAPIRLDGFTYEMADPKWNAVKRIEWLARDNSGATQPYYQLARYFDGVGKTSDAKKVRIALEKMLYPQDDSLLKVLKKPIGYGYRPENAVIGLAVTGVVGWLVYWRSYRMRIMIPSDKVAADTFRRSGKLPASYPRFSPLIASLEYTFPLVKLGQADKWQPESSAPPLTGNVVERVAQLLSLRRSLRWILWGQIILGWLLATLFVASITGLVQHGN